MPTAFRIFKTKRAAGWLDGEGPFRHGGRWNSRGTRLIYASSTLSLAMLEILVHLEAGEMMPYYSYGSFSFSERLVLNVTELHTLPSNWADYPAPLSIRTIGDDWVKSRRSAVLRVPTSIVPGEHNYLINLAHRDFPKIGIGRVEPIRFDRRIA